MSMDLVKQSLFYQAGKSNISSFTFKSDCFEDIIAQYIKKEAVVVVWFINKVSWGQVKAGIIELIDNEPLNLNLVLELRIFNEQEELYLKKGNDEFRARYICDTLDGDMDVEFVDSMGRLWGTNTGYGQQGVKLEDRNRKIKMTIPVAEDSKYYGLVTRNYIGFSDNEVSGAKVYLAGYDDYRFLRIEAWED